MQTHKIYTEHVEYRSVEELIDAIIPHFNKLGVEGVTYHKAKGRWNNGGRWWNEDVIVIEFNNNGCLPHSEVVPMLETIRSLGNQKMVLLISHTSYQGEITLTRYEHWEPDDEQSIMAPLDKCCKV